MSADHVLHQFQERSSLPEAILLNWEKLPPPEQIKLWGPNFKSSPSFQKAISDSLAQRTPEEMSNFLNKMYKLNKDTAEKLWKALLGESKEKVEETYERYLVPFPFPSVKKKEVKERQKRKKKPSSLEEVLMGDLENDKWDQHTWDTFGKTIVIPRLLDMFCHKSQVDQCNQVIREQIDKLSEEALDTLSSLRKKCPKTSLRDLMDVFLTIPTQDIAALDGKCVDTEAWLRPMIYQGIRKNVPLRSLDQVTKSNPWFEQEEKKRELARKRYIDDVIPMLEILAEIPKNILPK